MTTHRIHLRGPWHLTCHGDSESRALHIKNENDWPSLDGQFVLERSFNWTFPNPSPESVVLVIEGNAVNARVELNQHELDIETGTTQDVSGILSAHNHLSLELHSTGQEPLITRVYLAIE